MILEILQTVLLIILVDRNLIIRDRYRIAIENHKPNKYGKGYFAIWKYCKKANEERYMRDGGKRLWYFYYGKQLDR